LKNSGNYARAEVELHIDCENLQTSQKTQNFANGEVGSHIDCQNVQTSQNTENEPKGEVGLEIDHETTPSHSEESDGNMERSRASEEGGHSVHSNLEVRNSGGSTIPIPTSTNTSKKNGEGKLSPPSSFPNEFVAELRAMRATRDSEVEVMRKRLDLKQKKEERRSRKEERRSRKMYHMHLNTLLSKDHLSPQDEDIKCNLVAMLCGK